MINRIKEEFVNQNVEFKDYMVYSHIQPHTRPVEALKSCCSAVITSEYYFTARYFDHIEDGFAEKMVAELKKLQITDEKSDKYGCMLWYREETFVTDSNGAFFVLLPLALAYRFCYEKLTDFEKESISELLKRAGVWFNNETHGSIYYPNKIMSDGAMLALINHITGEYEEEYKAFWKKWLSYVNERGWGWGENTSDCYSNIMLAALNIATISIKDENLRNQVEEKRDALLDYILFHEGKEFVPSIRTYNFSGDKNYGGYVYKCFNNPESLENIAPFRFIIMHEAGMKCDNKNNGTERKEHIFDGAYAYTWKGKNIRLGSVTRFPVMKDSYQREGWGLGWQTMPASVLVEDTHVAFLRMRTTVNNNEHYHPAINKHNAFLNNRLFEDGNLVTVNTFSSQNKNIAIVSRGIKKLANSASGIYDEWCFPCGYEEIEEYNVNGRKWYAVIYKKNAVLITNVGGIKYGDEEREKIECKSDKKGDFSVITAALYSGEQKLLFSERLESAWVVIALEKNDGLEEYLKNIEINDEILLNICESEITTLKKRRISVSDGKIDVCLEINPDKER